MSNVSNYNRMLYNSGPISFSDAVAEKPDKIHQQLYRDALQKYFVEHPEYSLYRSAYHFIEIKNNEYLNISKNGKNVWKWKRYQ